MDSDNEDTCPKCGAKVKTKYFGGFIFDLVCSNSDCNWTPEDVDWI